MLIGVHYFTDVVLGAILGITFPYLVRDRFAARRWLFEYAPDGGYRLRGTRTQAWLGWPEGFRRSQDNSARKPGGAGGRQLSSMRRLRGAGPS